PNYSSQTVSVLINNTGVTATPNYTLSASPSSVTTKQGGNGQSTITVTPQNGFSGNVTMSTSTLPSGVTAAFSPNPTSPTTNRSTLTLTASSTATTGMVTVTITGTSGSLTNTTTLTLTVNPAAPPPNYTLSASPSSVTMNQADNGQSTITLTQQNVCSGKLTTSTSTLPSGVTAAFSPNPTSPTTHCRYTTLFRSSTATTGMVTVTITGTSGSLTNTTTLTLTVNPAAPPPNYTLSASPSSVTMNRSEERRVGKTCTPQNGSRRNMTMANATQPSGAP